MNQREQRVVDAFLKCIKNGEYTVEYAVTLIEDNARYGWMGVAAKEAFYAGIEPEPEISESTEENKGEEIEIEVDDEVEE